MIDPKPTDIGRLVVYRPRHLAATPKQGVITSFNAAYVFVRWGRDDTPKGHSPCDLAWANPHKPDKLVEAALVESILEDQP